MPITPEDDPKLQKLDKALKAARQEFEEDYNPKPDPAIASSGGIDSSSVAYEFLAYVISGGILGYVIDLFSGFFPWSIMAGILLGLVAGVFRANYRMNN